MLPQIRRSEAVITIISVPTLQFTFVPSAESIICHIIHFTSIYLVLMFYHLDQSFAEDERRLRQDIAILRKKAEQLNTPSTFTESAKIEREANRKEKELRQLASALTRILIHPALDFLLFTLTNLFR